MSFYWNWVWFAVAVSVVLLITWLLRVGWREHRAEWGNKLINSLDGLVRLVCRRYHGFEHDEIPLPTKGGALLAANHVSGLDPLLMACACPKPLRFMIATEQYNRGLLNWLYKGMGTIPVDRSGAPDKAFYAARKALEEGELIGVFPQGRIIKPGESELVPLKRGVILLADLAKVPIIPLRFSGISGVGRLFSALFMRSRARMTVGPLIWVEGPKDEQALARLQAFITGAAMPGTGARSNPG